MLTWSGLISFTRIVQGTEYRGLDFGPRHDRDFETDTRDGNYLWCKLEVICIVLSPRKTKVRCLGGVGSWELGDGGGRRHYWHVQVAFSGFQAVSDWLIFRTPDAESVVATG